MDRVEICEEFGRRIARYSIKLGVARSLFGEMRVIRVVVYLIESCKEFEECEVFDRVGSCKENVRRNVRCLIELRAVRSLFGEM